MKDKEQTNGVTEFTATLYFSTEPYITAELLFEAWAREGYQCEWRTPHASDALFNGLRGSTFIKLSKPCALQTLDQTQVLDAAREKYAQLARVDLDWENTYCINPQAALQDMQSLRYEMSLCLRMLAQTDQPRMDHNEWVATLLGIHQVAAIQLLHLHPLDIFVGQEDLNDYLSYADSQIEDTEPQFAPMLAFGTFVQQDGAHVSAWSTGLAHFSHPDLWLEEEGLTPSEALTLIFNASYLITSGVRYAAGHTLESGEVYCNIVEENFNQQQALRLKVRSA